MNKFRYILRGLIDGCLSVTGVLIGAYNSDFSIIISAGIAGAVANGFSNMLAAFSAEQTVRLRNLKELEETMLTSLQDTVKNKQIKKTIRNSAFYDGTSTIAGGILPVIPFFFATGDNALIISLLITLFLFVGMGIYMGKISRTNIFISVFKMIILAAVTAGACTLVRFFI
ncbi:MAG: VIT1/CCC1 transporter family protein [Elusimicrobiota bacterium]